MRTMRTPVMSLRRWICPFCLLATSHAKPARRASSYRSGTSPLSSWRLERWSAKGASARCSTDGGTERLPSDWSTSSGTTKTSWRLSNGRWWRTATLAMRMWCCSWGCAWAHRIWPSSPGREKDVTDYVGDEICWGLNLQCCCISCFYCQALHNKKYFQTDQWEKSQVEMKIEQTCIENSQTNLVYT